MADLGLLPSIFARHAASFHTPWVAIAVSSAVTLGISFLAFDDIVATANFLYSLGTLLEFAAFLWLHTRLPGLKRPYHVPLPLPALAAMCAVPSAFLVYVCVVAGWRVFALAGALTPLGIGLHGAMRLCRSKKWLRFNTATAVGAAAEDGQGEKRTRRDTLRKQWLVGSFIPMAQHVNKSKYPTTDIFII
ncbi:putative polyamine transporter [Dichanthelium oligosanthes]|uniref:Putative polyamine transporter n=1 Tax=Dichanthelium oligosanthes TaxID=888268 RepID=A0A1E5UT06_9POAL|nr:putative polyamine transporter [Dichanthelium oligosanthes]